MKKSNAVKQPFFAQFLEAQLKPEDQSGGQGTSPTNPSTDNITIPEKDVVTKPSADHFQTMKYPSDTDEI